MILAPVIERDHCKEKEITCYFASTDLYDDWAEAISTMVVDPLYMLGDEPDTLQGSVEAIDEILESFYKDGGSADSKDRRQVRSFLVPGHNRTLLSVCVENDWPRCVSLLLEKYWQDVEPWRALADPLFPGDQYGNTAAHAAVYKGHVACLRAILAAMGRVTDPAKLFLQLSQTLTRGRGRGETALQVAQRREHWACYNLLVD